MNRVWEKVGEWISPTFPTHCATDLEPLEDQSVFIAIVSSVDDNSYNYAGLPKIVCQTPNRL